MMIIKKLKYNRLIVVAITILLAACGSDDTDLQRYLNDIKTRPVKPIEPIPEFVLPPKFAYPENDKRRSPFKPIAVEMPSKESFTPNTNRPKQPLEAFPLDALKFVGVIKEGSVVWGLIQQPDGLVSRVKPGDYMGKNFGQIIRIDDSSIQLEEIVQVAGKWEKQMFTLKLHSPE